MKIHDLQPAPGSRQPKKRVARGIGGKGGKTAGRGTKGQYARGSVPAGFEGGQTPLHRRIPKGKGFKNPFRVEYVVVNLDRLDAFDSGAEVTPESLREKGLIAKKGYVKVLGRGELNKALTVRVHAYSTSAGEAIRRAGGTTDEIPMPFGVRPAAKGNQHTSRTHR